MSADSDSLKGNKRAVFLEQALRVWNAPLSQAARILKYRGMAESPYMFLRACNHLFWREFANDKRLKRFGNARTRTCLQGDLHAYNYGAFHDKCGKVVYGLNDFDEALIADYQYDVWRMAGSLVLIMQEKGDFSVKQQKKQIKAFSRAYLKTLRRRRGNTAEKSCSVIQTDEAKGALKGFLKKLSKKRKRSVLLDKWTMQTSRGRRFKKLPGKLRNLTPRQREALEKAWPAAQKTFVGLPDIPLRKCKIIDAVRRINAGLGSLGTPRYYLLVKSAGTLRILDLKRQSYPSAYHFLGPDFQKDYRRRFPHPGQRHASAAGILAGDADAYLGWLALGKDIYSVREVSPYKEAFPVQKLKTPGAFKKQVRQWGGILAEAHAGSSKEAVPYLVEKQILKAVGAHHKDFYALVTKIAFAYAGQVQTDWSLFKAQSSYSIIASHPAP